MKLKFKSSNLKVQKAFSLVEVLVVVVIMSVAFISFYTVSTVGTKYIIESKNRLLAVALLNEKVEIIRNLAYDDIGLQEGVEFNGKILQDENVTANGRAFHVYTQMRYEDDPYDGLIVNGTDPIPNDYKLVRIVVSWRDSNGQIQEVASVSRFVPPGLETDDGGAPLAINISDSSGNGVSQASVHIVNNSVSPAINITMQTDNEGHLMFPSAKPSIGGYNFTITKNGYETISTMLPTATFIPTYPHASVILASLNTYSYTQNQLSTLTIQSRDYQNNPVGDIGFSIEGGKIIGYDIVEDPIGSGIFHAVNKFNMSSMTGTTGSTSGKKEYENISPGSYQIDMSANAQYEFIDFDPSQSPAQLVPGDDITYVLRVADKSTNALFLDITDSEGNPIAEAEVKMKDIANNEIFSGKKSSLRGVVFYPDDATVLVSEEYELEITAEGFITETTTVIVNGLTKKSVQLTSI